MALFGHNSYMKIKDEMPDKSLAKFFYKLGVFFPKIFALNLLMLLFSLGIVTVPAVVTAANRVLLNILREKDFSVWGDFWAEFKVSFQKMLLLGLFFSVFYAVGILTLEMIPGNFEGTAKVIAVAFPSFVLLFTWIVSSYTFALQAFMELSNSQLIKNATLLTFIAPRETFQIIGAGLFVLLCVFAFPYSIILILPGGAGIVQYVVCRAFHSAMQQYILPPEEDEENQEN